MSLRPQDEITLLLTARGDFVSAESFLIVASKAIDILKEIDLQMS